MTAKPRADRTTVAAEDRRLLRLPAWMKRAVEKLGAKPLQPMLDEIAAEGARTSPALLGELHLHSSGERLLFGFGSTQDLQRRHRGDRRCECRRPGPARSRLLHEERREVEGDPRASTWRTSQKMFELLGESPSGSEADAATVMRIETALAKASLTRVERRDPYNARSQDERWPSSTSWRRHFDWTTYLRGRRRASRRHGSTSREPEVLQGARTRS